MAADDETLKPDKEGDGAPPAKPRPRKPKAPDAARPARPAGRRGSAAVGGASKPKRPSGATPKAAARADDRAPRPKPGRDAERPKRPPTSERRGPEGDRRPRPVGAGDRERRGPEGDRRPRPAGAGDRERRGPEGDRRPRPAGAGDRERHGPEGDRRPRPVGTGDRERRGPEGDRRPRPAGAGDRERQGPAGDRRPRPAGAGDRERRGPGGDRRPRPVGAGDRERQGPAGDRRPRPGEPWPRERRPEEGDAGPQPLRVVGPLNARSWALAALQRIEEDKAYVARLEPDARLVAGARRSATDLLAGVTRWRRWLDHLIDRTFSGKPDQLDPVLRQVLRLGLYELFYTGTPPHAAVHAAVGLARDQGLEKGMGLVNAILRKLDQQREELPAPATGDPLEDLAIRHSHPTWLVRRWRDRFGMSELQALLAWNNRRPRHGLRVNRLQADLDTLRAELADTEAGAEPSPWLPADFLRIQRLQPVLDAGLVARGLAAIQDEAAALVVLVLDPRPDESIVDLCAAPGGKACFAAARMEDRGRLLAIDLHPGKLRLIATAARRLGLSCLQPLEADLLRLHELRDASGQPLVRQADRVLLDAPCSGTGVLARRADLRWQREAKDLADLCRQQDRMLDAAASLVRPDGLLVYSTCSLEPEENEGRVAAFLERHPDFVQESAAGLVPPELLDADGAYRSLPQRHGMDGAYAARLRRRRMVARR